MRRRSSYGGFGSTRRTRKIRNPISVKAKVAKKGGKCSACRGRFEVGDQVTYVKVKRRVYHTTTCVPANVTQGLGVGPVPGAPVAGVTPGEIAEMLKKSKWSIGEAQLVGLLALENALVAKLAIVDPTPEMEKGFDRYNKLKSVAMRPGSDPEGKQAMKMATVELVKLVFGA